MGCMVSRPLPLSSVLPLLPHTGKYHFICECFFMAARALQLGLVQCLDARQDLARWLRNYQEDIEALEG